MEEIKKAAGHITGIYTEPISLSEPFIDFSARFASMPGTTVLMSGGDLDSARHHIFGAKPWLVFSGRGRNMTITVENQTFDFMADPFDTLRMILKAFRLNDLDLDPSDLPKPIYAGLLGYLAYDLKDCLEKLPRTSIDRLCLPHLYFMAPSIIVVHNKSNDTTRLCIPERNFVGKSNLGNDLDAFKRIISDRPPKHGSFSGDAGGFKSNFTQSGYMNAIKKIKEYIAAGDIYQVNMSQRFEMDVEGDTFSLFKTLYNNNPAPFFRLHSCR